MTRQRLWAARPYDDRGTSLVLALLFITVGSLVLAAVLALADTGMRGTIELSSQAGLTSAAEGAANIAINDLRGGTYAGTGTCFGGSNNRQLDHFYQQVDGTWDSARVECELDTANSTAPIPPWGLLTLDKTNGPLGISVINPQINNSTTSLSVTGDVYSNSNIAVQTKIFGLGPSGNVAVANGTIKARLSCTSGSGLFSPPPNPTCNTGTAVSDPPYSVAPFTGLPTPALPSCAPVMIFQPGHYTNQGLLNFLASSACQGGNGVLHFLPGVYYFDFGPSILAVPWTLSAGTVVGGALRSGVILGPAMALQNNCVSPIPTGSGWVAPDPHDGVTFVFNGVSQMIVTGSAKVELCGRYTPLDAPIAVYAESPTGLLASTCSQTTWPCAAVSTIAPTAFVVQGTVFLPSRELVLGLSNSSTQDLRGGAVVHRALASTTRSTGLTAVIEEPTTPLRTIVRLNVYVCPDSSTCPTNGQLLLKTKVSIFDQTGAPVTRRRQMTVLSWSLRA